MTGTDRRRGTGGGGQFGIVVEFVFKVHPPVGPISSGILAFPGTEIDKILAIIPVCAFRFAFGPRSICLTVCAAGMEEDPNVEGALHDELLQTCPALQGRFLAFSAISTNTNSHHFASLRL